MPFTGRAEDEWDDIRAEVEGGGSISVIAKRVGLSRTAIYKKARLESWSGITERTTIASVDTIDARAKAAGVDPDADEDTPGPADRFGASERQKVIERHRKEWDILVPLKMEIERVYDPGYVPEGMKNWGARTRAAYQAILMRNLNAGALGLLTAQEGERRAHGFDYKLQQKSADGGSDANQRRRELLASMENLMAIAHARAGAVDVSEDSGS